MFPDANCGESSASSGDVERHGKHRKTPLVQTAHAFSRQSSSVREYIERGAEAASSEVAFAARIVAAMPDGTGAVMLDGKMQDDATWKQAKVIVDLARLVAKKDPDRAAAYGF